MSADLPFNGQTVSAQDGVADYAAFAQIKSTQGLLFALTTMELCAKIGLSLQDAEELHQNGLLSFSPLTPEHLDESQETELRFLGALVVAGCDLQMVRHLTGPLQRPYAYDLRRIFFDWQARTWRLLPDSQAEAAFSEWLEGLIASEDAGTLVGIIELATEALDRVRNED